MAHTAAALVAKRAEPRLPLWACLVGAWVFDLTGVGHWWPVGAVFAAGAVAIVRWRILPMRAALVLGAAVSSHAALDLVVGLQSWPGADFLGLQLHGIPELTVECGLMALAVLLYEQRAVSRPSYASVAAIGMLVAVTVVYALALPSDPAAGPEATAGPIFVLELGALIISSALLIADDRRGLDAGREDADLRA